MKLNSDFLLNFEMSLDLPEHATGHEAPYPLAKEVPYEYPAPEGVVGAAAELSSSTPKLFQPLKIGNMTIGNRIVVSPMCQYTADAEYVTDYHKVHYGGLTTRGPGMVVVEASTVAPRSGSSIVDLGFWKDSHAAKMKPIVDFAHANTSKIGIQFTHAGRKSLQSTLFDSLEDWDPRGSKEDVKAPSAVPFRPGGRLPVPKELSIEEIKTIIKRFGAAAKRAHEIAGFDFIEIHSAHGYLLNEFLSAHSNKRTDEYGGSFEKRIKFVVDIIDEVRANVPKDFPVLLRISGSELHDASPDAWKIEDSIKFAHIVFEHGVNLLDVSAGGNDTNADRPEKKFGYNVHLAKAIKESVGDKGLVASVGGLHDPVQVNELIANGDIDAAFIGVPFLFNPGLVFDWAKALDVEINTIKSHWAYKPKYAEMVAYIKETEEKNKSS